MNDYDYDTSLIQFDNDQFTLLGDHQGPATSLQWCPLANTKYNASTLSLSGPVFTEAGVQSVETDSPWRGEG